MNNFVGNVREAGQLAMAAQSRWALRKDSLTGLVVLLTFVVSSAQAVDWSDVTSWLPVVGSWIVAVVGVAIHRFTEGAITQKGVEKIVREAEYIGRHRADGE